MEFLVGLEAVDSTCRFLAIYEQWRAPITGSFPFSLRLSQMNGCLVAHALLVRRWPTTNVFPNGTGDGTQQVYARIKRAHNYCIT